MESPLALLFAIALFVRVVWFVNLCVAFLLATRQTLVDDPIRGPWGLIENLRAENRELRRELEEARRERNALRRESLGWSALLIVSTSAALAFGGALMHFIDTMEVIVSTRQPVEQSPPQRVHASCPWPAEIRRPPRGEDLFRTPYEPWPGPLGIRFPANRLAPRVPDRFSADN